MKRRETKNAGFTLIEVLAALLVFSIGIIGLTQAGTQSARAVSAIDNKMLASIVADNQLILARQAPLQLGSDSGVETAMSRRFDYRIETSRTETPEFYRILITVRQQDQEQVLIERTAFRGNTR